MNINPYRDTPDRGSISAKVVGAANIVGGTLTTLVGLKGRSALFTGGGLLQHYVGARIWKAGDARKPAHQAASYSSQQGLHGKKKK